MPKVSSSVEMYPSPAELFENVSLTTALRKEPVERYATHGPEYVTEERHEDGRVINHCMTANAAQEALEEVTDAMFNLCVLQFRGFAVGGLIKRTQELWSSVELLRDWIEDNPK